MVSAILDVAKNSLDVLLRITALGFVLLFFHTFLFSASFEETACVFIKKDYFLGKSAPL